jgi:hypothetical protein
MELGALGEFVSSLVVLATLLILLFQVRGARAEFTSQIIREIKRHNNQDIQLPFREPWTTEAHIRAQRDFDSLEKTEKLYWGVWLYSWITQTEDAWLMRRRGIGEIEMVDNMVGGVASVLRSDGGQEMWPRIKHWFDTDFAAAVQAAIEANDATWLDTMLGTGPSSLSPTSAPVPPGNGLGLT